MTQDSRNCDGSHEKRSSDRETCLLPVDYAAHNRVYRDFIKNISPQGIYVESRANMEVGASVLMTFNLMDSALPVKSMGTVMHSSPFGFGVRFDAPLIRFANA